MSIWRQVTRGVRVLMNRSAEDRQLAEEVGHYVDQVAADLVAQGMTPSDARRAAQLRVGNATVMREQARTYGWENAVETFLSDLRYAIRRMRRSLEFTA